MIRFGIAKIENFLTVKECSVDFSTPGLYGVLGPNGAGKSSLFLETLLYPLFGITERFGTERDQVVNRFLGKDCHVHLPFWVEEMPVIIDAYRKHTKFKDELFLKVDGKDASGRTNAHTWGKIEKLLDMDSVSFSNCFQRNTEIITNSGIKKIGELDGKSAVLLSDHGKWIKSTIKMFGKQKLFKLIVKKNRRIKEIYTTENHRWFVYKRHRPDRTKVKELTTIELKYNDRLKQSKSKRCSRNNPSPFGIARGFVYGDGTTRYIGSGEVNAFGEKDKALHKYFQLCEMRQYSNHGGQTTYSQIPYSWRKLPELTENSSFLLGWLAGYFAADGCVSEDGSCNISSSKQSNINFVKSVCSILGIPYFNDHSYTCGGFKKSGTCYSIFLDSKYLKENFFIIEEHKKRFLKGQTKRDWHWRVVSVEPTNIEEEVYCAIVPEKHSFTLEGDILTGNSIVFGQSVAQYFSALTDSQQKAVIERIIGLSWVPKAYELSGADVKEAQLEEGKLSSKLAELYQRHMQVKANLDEYGKKLEDFEDAKHEKIKELGLSILKLEDTSELEKLLLYKEQKMLECEKKYVSKDELVKQNDELSGTMAESIASIRIKTAEKQKVLTKIKNLVLLGKEVTTCDVCGQVITPESVKQYDSHLIEHIKHLDLDIKSYEEIMDEVNELRQPIKEKLDALLEIERELKRINIDVNLHRSQLTQIQIRNAGTEEKNRGIDKRMQEIENEVSPYEALISKLEQDLATLENTRNDMKKEFDVKQGEIKYHEFMVELFSNRGYKSFVIESVLPDADRFASIYSRALGGKFEISFSPTTALKGGEVREKFNVQVNNRYGSSVYYGNSNGEKRAIDSIVMFCLGDLAASRLNKKVSLLILDDVFEKLDEQSCEDIVKVLKMMVTPRELRDNEYCDLPERESIFVLTHLNQLKESFDNKMIVSRDTFGFTQIIEN